MSRSSDEFIHCQQAESCEQRLKQSLGIARQAQDTGDFMELPSFSLRCA